MLFLRACPNGCMLAIRVHPCARRNAITGIHDGALKVSLTTPPTDGRANAALIAFLSDRLDVPRASLELVTGQASRTKSIRVTGLTPDEVEQRLLAEPG